MHVQQKYIQFLKGILSVGIVSFLLTRVYACAKIHLLFDTLKRCIILDVRRVCGAYPQGTAIERQNSQIQKGEPT